VGGGREQRYLLPETFDANLGEEDPVRFLYLFVEKQDRVELDIRRQAGPLRFELCKPFQFVVCPRFSEESNLLNPAWFKHGRPALAYDVFIQEFSKPEVASV